ncbi:MAG: hypothetical protein Q8P31_06185 [Bacillota bacterium]|nr:hypothetical protein [Bacillota bacterium]
MKLSLRRRMLALLGRGALIPAVLAAGLAREGLAQARRSVLKLRPLPPLEAGLRNGLERLASGFAVRGLQVHTELADPAQMPVDAEEALYRVA